MAKVAITPAVLQWAMLQASSSSAELAEATNRPQSTVTEWLEGVDKPHTGDLINLAKQLGRPPELFLRREPPVEDPVSAFRRSTFGGKDAPESAVESAAVRRAESIREMASWLAKAGDAAIVPWPTPSTTPTASADNMRRFLGWNTREDQVKATSKAATFRRLRHTVESLGVVVIVEDLGEEASRGFSLPDQHAPLIYINNAARLASVRTFTLLHEVSHLMHGESALHHSEDRKEEVRAEQFASAFLFPKDQFIDYVSNQRKKTFLGPADVNDVRLISERFKASWHAVAIRLKTLGLADDRLVEAVAKGEKDAGWSPVPQTRPRKRVAEFGYTYPRLLADAVEGRRLSEFDARRYLRLTKKDELSEVHALVRMDA